MISNPNITPLQFLSLYQNLTAHYSASENSPIYTYYGIKLKRYYINYRGLSTEDILDKIEENKEDGLTDAEKKENRKLKRRIPIAQKTANITKLISRLRRGKARDVKFAINEVRYGKGLPEDYEIFLDAAIAAGLCSVGKGNPPTQQSIQAFLDKSRIGIDCSGYASAFFAARGDIRESSKGDITRIGAAGWGSRRGNKQITRINDIRMGDCLVVVKSNGKLLRSPGHIMLANGPGRADVRNTMEFKPLDIYSDEGGESMGESNGSVYICESRGEGLSRGPATFRAGYPSKKRPYFQIRRHGRPKWLNCIVVRPDFKKG